MTFAEYDIVKSQYIVSEQFVELRLYLCADKQCTDHVWQAPLSIQTEIKSSNNFYLLSIPKGLDFTEECYETFKRMFVRYIKGEKIKEKLEKVQKDFI